VVACRGLGAKATQPTVRALAGGSQGSTIEDKDGGLRASPGAESEDAGLQASPRTRTRSEDSGHGGVAAAHSRERERETAREEGRQRQFFTDKEAEQRLRGEGKHRAIHAPLYTFSTL